MEKKETQRNIHLLKNAVLFLLIGFLLVPSAAWAASLYLSPSSGSFRIGQTINVQIFVSSNDRAMNAASGILSFPQDKLAMISLSKAGSIISLWVQEPSFSNTTGTINFEGIVLNPGFTGSAGRLLSAAFRVKAGGVASTTFASGSVLANDGQGTNILTGMSGAEFSLGAIVPRPDLTPAPGSPVAPVVVSSTHPDSDKWYATNNAVFSWNVPSGVTAIRLLVGGFANSIPTIVYEPPISSRDLSELNLIDGIWYFHAQFRNAIGWGGIAHFRFQIDTVKPTAFSVIELKREDLTDPVVQLQLEAKDTTSGIDHYEIQIDGEAALSWKDDGSGVYKTPVLLPGDHSVIAKAIDKAGNAAVETVSVIVQPLLTPIILEYPQELRSGDILSLKGDAIYANSQVTIWIQRDEEKPKSYSVTSDRQSLFMFSTDERFPEGLYKIWVVVADERGAQSNPSEKVTTIIQQQAFLKLGSLAITLLAVIVPLIALIFGLIFLIWFGWNKFSQFKRRLRKEIREAEEALHKSTDILKKDLGEQIRLLEYAKDRRKLTQEEERIIRQLRKNLDDVEKFVEKEIRDIKREVD